MAIKNIQTLQSNHNIFEQDAKEQYIQALANAGQRIGVKGDSITLDQFNFMDILTENSNYSEIDPETHLGKLVYSLDSNGIPQCTFSVLTKNDFVNGKFDKVFDQYTINYKDIFNVYNSDTFSFDIQLNNYAFVKENSMFKLDKNYFTNILFAKIIGSDEDNVDDDVAKYNLELHYDKYNTETNKLTDAIRIFHLNDYDNPEFAMLYYKWVSGNIYDLTAWHLVIPKTRPLEKQTFENYLCNSKDTNRSKYDIFSLIESLDISDIDGILNKDSKIDTIFSYFLKNGTKINPSTHIYIEFDSTISNGYSFMKCIDEENQIYESIVESDSQIDELFSSYEQLVDKFDVSIKDRIYYMSNDIALLYPRLLEKYCNDIFFANISSLSKQIFCRLYENILLEYSNHIDISDNSDFTSIYNVLNDSDYNIVMYVPLSYNLKYYCNSQNHNQIYNSNNIYVSFINNLSGMISSRLEKLVESSQTIIVDYNDVDKTSVYQFAFDYNDDLNSTALSVKSLSLDKLYTLPYIDKSSSCWVINDTITNFKTIADNVSPQTILITYNTIANDECKYTILNGLSKDIAEVFNTSNNTNEIIRWLERSCQFSTNILVGSTNDEIKSAIEDMTIAATKNNITQITAKCLVPHIRIDSNLVSTFENAILFTIFDLTTFIDSIPDKFKSGIAKTNIYNTYIFSTIWKLDKDNIITDENDVKYYAFDYIREIENDLNSDQQSNFAFDASIFFNNNIAAVRQSLSNLNFFDSIVFYNGEVVEQYKDNYTSNKQLLTIYNPSSTTYDTLLKKINSVSDTETTKFVNNNYILSIKTNLIDYNSIYTRLFDSSTIDGNNISSDKFLNLDTHSWQLFDRYYKYTYQTTGNVNIPVSELSNSGQSNASLSQGGTTNSRSYYKVIPISNTNTWKYNNTVTTNESTEYYDDKVFSSNVPLLDLKEILLFNTTSLNRFNIIYPDINTIYNAFLGFPINDKLNKIYIYDRENESQYVAKNNIVELAASETNINIGNENLVSNADKNKFSKPSTLHVKYDNVIIESDNIVHKTKKYTDILCAGGLTSVGDPYIENVLIKSSSLIDYNNRISYEQQNYQIENENNLPKKLNNDGKFSPQLLDIINTASTLKFGLDENINDASNLVLFTKEFTPVSAVLDYFEFKNVEAHPFGNALNILWLGDRDKYKTNSTVESYEITDIFNSTPEAFYNEMSARFTSSAFRYDTLPEKYTSYSYSYTYSYVTTECNNFNDYYNLLSYISTDWAFDEVFMHYMSSINNKDNAALYWLRSNKHISNTASTSIQSKPDEYKFKYDIVDEHSKFVIEKITETSYVNIKCGLETFSKYSNGDEIVPAIFKNNGIDNYASDVSIVKVLRDLGYTENTANEDLIKGLSINAFFISTVSPDDEILSNVYLSCFQQDNSEISTVQQLINQHSFNNSKRIYIFRLSDYLYKQYGLDITNENDFVIDEEFSVQNKIFRIAINQNVESNGNSQIINNNGTRYAYFLIYDEDDITIRKFRYSTNDVYINNTLNMVDELTPNKENLTKDKYNINYYEVAYPKRPIKLVKRKIVQYRPTEDYVIENSSANHDLIYSTNYVYNILF